MLAALFFCSEWSVSENSDSVAREGTTDTITSEARCAIRATVTSSQYYASGFDLDCVFYARKAGVDNSKVGGACAGNVPASPAVLMELMVTANWWRGTVEEQAGLQKRQDDVLTTRVVGDSPLSHHRQRQWQIGQFFSKRRDHAAPNCVIDASALSGSCGGPANQWRRVK
jgi:hypothetical protein